MSCLTPPADTSTPATAPNDDGGEGGPARPTGRPARGVSTPFLAGWIRGLELLAPMTRSREVPISAAVIERATAAGTLLARAIGTARTIEVPMFSAGEQGTLQAGWRIGPDKLLLTIAEDEFVMAIETETTVVTRHATRVTTIAEVILPVLAELHALTMLHGRYTPVARAIMESYDPHGAAALHLEPVPYQREAEAFVQALRGRQDSAAAVYRALLRALDVEQASALESTYAALADTLHQVVALPLAHELILCSVIGKITRVID